MSKQQAESQKSVLPDGYLKVDRRYRESKYFLADQLRYAESVQEFRSVKQAIQRSTEFSVGNRAFQFARVPIPVNDT